MSHFQAKYTDQQRDAIAAAFEDRRIRPANRVVTLAAAGELEYEGERLAPFEVPAATVRDAARDLRKRRLGQVSSRLEHLPPRDAIEVLRRRMVNVADAELGLEERKKLGRRDPERMRQFARLLRELQAIPGPKDAARPAPGAKTNGTQHGGQTRGGMAGELIAAHRKAEGPTAPDARPTQTTTENGDDTREATRDATEDEDEAQERRPGSLARGSAASELEHV